MVHSVTQRKHRKCYGTLALRNAWQYMVKLRNEENHWDKDTLWCKIKESPAVRFLTRTFGYVFYVRVGKLIVCLWHSQRSRTVV